MKASLCMVLFLLAILVGASGAVGHPHMFLDTTAQFKMDDRNRLSSLKLRFVVDELNTALTIATLELDKDGDKKLSQNDKKKVAGNVVEGFGHYKYFTYLLANNRNVPLKAPTYADVDLVDGKLVIAMEIDLNEPFVVAGQSLTLKLYDPSYFTEVTLKEAPRVIGRNSICKVKFHKATPDENSRKLQVSLSQLSREETPEIEDVGALFADDTRLICAG